MRDIVPFEGLRIRNRFRDLFDDFFNDSFFYDLDFPAKKEIFRRAFAELEETDKEIIAKVELPGIEKENVEIVATGDGLEIKGMKKEEKEKKDKDSYSYSSRSVGFKRYISLPEYADIDKATASYKNGLLEVRIPKKTTSKQRQKIIEVK
ncbi:MAG: Hsp20/alpha crystallin family protein [Candidatus Diapherotrites archaeon]|nr:Hsp20/alpha crystallin family protein [Candidatus Diapherotrites archaeon]